MLRFALTVILCLSVLPPGPAAAAGSFAPPETVSVPAGPFIAGSDRAEREAAYRLDEAAYGHRATRDQRWYEGEGPRREVVLPAFSIMRRPVTNRLYAGFVAATGHPAPEVSAADWAGYGLIHPYERTRRHAWRDGRPPAGREDHPVVLVSRADARAFAAWLSAETGRHWRLPWSGRRRPAAPTAGAFPGAISGTRGGSTATMASEKKGGPSTPCRSAVSRPGPAPTACSTPRGRSSSGPPRRPREGPRAGQGRGERAASWSRAAPGTTGAAASAVPRRATAARPVLSIFSLDFD